MRPFVELEGVGVSYGEVRVLDGINLTVEPGDFLGIIGPNGSGKTTLLRVMLGLLEPQEGSVRLFGQPPSAFREWRRLGYVPQRAALDPALPVTVGEVVTTGTCHPPLPIQSGDVFAADFGVLGKVSVGFA